MKRWESKLRKSKQSLSRIVGGVILDYNKNVKEYFKGDSLYTDLYPVYIEGFENPQIIIFDFYRLQTVKEDELKKTTKYKIFAKAKDKLFADILQKLSSHIARLGIAVIKWTIKNNSNLGFLPIWERTQMQVPLI